MKENKKISKELEELKKEVTRLTKEIMQLKALIHVGSPTKPTPSPNTWPQRPYPNEPYVID